MKNNHTHLTRLAAISLCLMMCLSSLAVLAPSASAAPATYTDTLVEPGFDIDITKELHLDQETAPTGEWRSHLYPGAWVDWTADGMVCTFDESESASNRQIYVGRVPANRIPSNTVRTIAEIDVNNTVPSLEYFRIKWQFFNSASSLLAEVIMAYSSTLTRCDVCNYASGSGIWTTCMLFVDNYARSDDGRLPLDLMVSIADGDTLIYYQNGVRWDIPFVGGALEDVHFGQVFFVTSSQWTNNYTATLKYIGIADLDDTSELRYVDNLHVSSTPYGCDMTLAFDIHADYSRYEMVDVMKGLADEYGIMGTLHTFVYGDPNYGEGFAENASLLASLKDARASGWELGTHALSSSTSIDRATAIAYLEKHKELLGEYPRIWTDHGYLSHNLWKDGGNQASDYYIADVLAEHLICAWLNVMKTYHQSGMDVNIDGMHVGEIGGIDTYSVSRGLYLSYLTNVKQVSYMGYMSSRATIVLHEYLTNLCVVRDGDTLIGTSSGPGVTVTPGWYASPQTNYQDNEWFLHPEFEASIEAMTSGGTVWSAGVSEIYQYTEAVRDLIIDEGATYIHIANPSSIDLRGLTLYTLDSDRPEYVLYHNGKYYAPQPAAHGWNFVIDNVPRGAVITLEKVERPSFMPEIMLDSSGLAMWADDKATYIYATQTGAAHVTLNRDYTDYMIRDASDNNIVYDAADGSVLFDAERGELYVIQSLSAYRAAQIDVAMSPLYAIIPVVVMLAVLGGVLGMLGKAFGRLKF
jgi:hypothetical protein